MRLSSVSGSFNMHMPAKQDKVHGSGNPIVVRTSPQITLSSAHMRRGSMFVRNGRLISASRISSSASRGWSGKLLVSVLHVLTAQVRKLSVRSFIFGRRGRGWLCDLVFELRFLGGVGSVALNWGSVFWSSGTNATDQTSTVLLAHWPVGKKSWLYFVRSKSSSMIQ